MHEEGYTHEDPTNHILHGVAYWRHLANKTNRSVRRLPCSLLLLLLQQLVVAVSEGFGACEVVRMSVDEDITDQQVLGEDEEETLSSLTAQLEITCQQLELDAIYGAGELLKRETNALKNARSIVEAQQRAEFMHRVSTITVIEAQQRAEFMRRLSSIVTDACCKLEAKMHVSFLHTCAAVCLLIVEDLLACTCSCNGASTKIFRQQCICNIGLSRNSMKFITGADLGGD